MLVRFLDLDSPFEEGERRFAFWCLCSPSEERGSLRLAPESEDCPGSGVVQEVGEVVLWSARVSLVSLQIIEMRSREEEESIIIGFLDLLLVRVGWHLNIIEGERESQWNLVLHVDNDIPS